MRHYFGSVFFVGNSGMLLSLAKSLFSLVETLLSYSKTLQLLSRLTELC